MKSSNSFLRIWSHLLKKSLMEKLHFLCSGWELKDFPCFWSFENSKKAARLSIVEIRIEQWFLRIYKSKLKTCWVMVKEYLHKQFYPQLLLTEGLRVASDICQTWSNKHPKYLIQILVTSQVDRTFI